MLPAGMGKTEVLALMVEKAAACASSAWLRFCSTEYSCMYPFTKAGLHPQTHACQRRMSKSRGSQFHLLLFAHQELGRLAHAHAAE